jgi:hypothetical protein
MHKTKGSVGVAPTLEHYKRAVMAAVDQNLFVGGRHFYAVEIRRRGPNKHVVAHAHARRQEARESPRRLQYGTYSTFQLILPNPPEAPHRRQTVDVSLRESSLYGTSLVNSGPGI